MQALLQPRAVRNNILGVASCSDYFAISFRFISFLVLLQPGLQDTL